MANRDDTDDSSSDESGGEREAVCATRIGNVCGKDSVSKMSVKLKCHYLSSESQPVVLLLMVIIAYLQNLKEIMDQVQ